MKPNKKGEFCVFVNSVWHVLKDTVGFGNVFRHSNFRKMIPQMKKGEVVQFSGHYFKVQQ